MSQELMTLRHNTYEAAGEFHHAQGEYFSLLTSKSQNVLQAAADKIHITGVKYMNALEALMSFCGRLKMRTTPMRSNGR
jgi:hypothetical protein